MPHSSPAKMLCNISYRVPKTGWESSLRGRGPSGAPASHPLVPTCLQSSRGWQRSTGHPLHSTSSSPGTCTAPEVLLLNHPLARGTCCGIEPCSSRGQKAKTCRARTGCRFSKLALFHLPIKPASRVKPKNIYSSLTRAVCEQVSAFSVVEQWLSSSRRQHGDAPHRMSPPPHPRPQQISSSLLS